MEQRYLQTSEACAEGESFAHRPPIFTRSLSCAFLMWQTSGETTLKEEYEGIWREFHSHKSLSAIFFLRITDEARKALKIKEFRSELRTLTSDDRVKVTDFVNGFAGVRVADPVAKVLSFSPSADDQARAALSLTRFHSLTHTHDVMLSWFVCDRLRSRLTLSRC